MVYITLLKGCGYILDKFIDLNNCNKVVQLLHESRSCAGQLMTVYKNCILVSIDFYEHFIFPQNKGIELVVLQGRELLLCKSIVLGIKNNENYMYLVLSPPEIIRIIDRRIYHRIPIDLKASYLPLATNTHFHLMTEIPTDILANHKYKAGIITDISGGGLRLQCSDNLELNSQIVVCMNVKCRLYLLSKITRKEVISDPNETIYLYGIYFDIITEKEREKIIEFVFENEIYIRAKNKIKT